MERQDLRFRAGGDACAAWLYPPAETGSTAPIVVMAHGLSGTRRDSLGPFAERFAEAGIAALVFDHRGFGDSEGEPDLFQPARQLVDWRAAIGFARTLPGIDPDRIATFGSSMGGGNALAAAAADPGVAAAVSQVPLLDILRQAHRPPPGVAMRALLAAALGHHLPAVGQPDEAAFINAPGGQAPLPLARLRRRGGSRGQTGPGDRGGTPRSTRRAAHLPLRRPLRHLRRSRARGDR